MQRGDIASGAELDPQTLDGLYLYREAERRNGGQFMWSYVHNHVVYEMGWLDWLPYLEGAPHWLANQLVNCFSLDRCGVGDRKDSYWATPGEGRAVSPDNILLWDPPTDDDHDGDIDHGVYGYSERMVYRSGGWKRVYRWAVSEGTGGVKGTVLYDNAPMPGATVILNAAGGLTTQSGLDGKFRFHAVPAGFYEIEAQQQLPDLFLSSRDQAVNIVEHKQVTIDLVLLPPAENLRQVIFADNLYHAGGEEPDPQHTWPHYHGFYHKAIKWGTACLTYWWAWEINDIVTGEGQLSCQVDPYTTPTDDIWWRHCLLGDRCLTVTGTCTLDPGTNDIAVSLTAFVGGASTTQSATVPPGSSVPLELHVKDKNWCFIDYEWELGDLWLLLTNSVQNYGAAAPSPLSAVEATDEAGAAGSVECQPIPVTGTPAFSSKGDAVSDSFAPPAPAARNVSHDGHSNFVVTLHCAGGSQLVQDAIGPVSESVRIDFAEGPCRWEVEADGNWTLTPP